MSSPTKQRRTVKIKRKNASPIKLEIENTEITTNLFGKCYLKILDEFNYSTESFLELPKELQMDEAFLVTAIQKNNDIFKVIPLEKKTKEFVLSLFKTDELEMNNTILNHLPLEFLSDPEFFKKLTDLVGSPCHWLSRLPQEIITKDFIISCIYNGVDCFILSNYSEWNELWKDWSSEDLKKLVQVNGNALEYIMNLNQMNEEIIDEAVKNRENVIKRMLFCRKKNPLTVMYSIKNSSIVYDLKSSVINYLRTENEEFFNLVMKEDALILYDLFSDYDMSRLQLIELVKKDLLNMNYYFERKMKPHLGNDEDIENIWFSLTKEKLSLENFIKRYPNDKRVVITAIKRGGHGMMMYASNELKSDVEFCKTVVVSSPKILEYASKEVRDDYEVMSEAIIVEIECLENCSDVMKGDLQFWKLVLSKKSKAFEYFPEQFRFDSDIARLAVEAYSFNLEFVSKDLKNDKELVMMAVPQFPWLFEYASNELRGDRDFIQKIYSTMCSFSKSNDFWYIIESCAPHLRNDKKFMLKSISKCIDCVAFLPDDLLKDIEFISELAMECPEFLEFVNQKQIDLKRCLLFNTQCFTYIKDTLLTEELCLLGCGSPFIESISNWHKIKKCKLNSCELNESDDLDESDDDDDEVDESDESDDDRDDDSVDEHNQLDKYALYELILNKNPLFFDKLDESSPLKNQKDLICRARGYMDSNFGSEFLENYLNRPNWFIFDKFLNLNFKFRDDSPPQTVDEADKIHQEQSNESFSFDFNGTEFKWETNFKFEENLFQVKGLNLNDELKFDFN